VEDEILYDAFGNVVMRDLSTVGDYTVPTPTPFLWGGSHQYQADYESGLMLLGNRYYDPAIGRFISQDPAQDESNWYAYCGNNPLVAVDPIGLKLLYSGFKHHPKALTKIKAAIARIATTPRGKTLVNSAVNGRSTVTIQFDKENSGQTVVNGDDPKRQGMSSRGVNDPTATATILIDPNDHLLKNLPGDDGAGTVPWTTERVLAHELGHAVGAADDDGPGDMNNVLRNENPVAVALGQPHRGFYNFPTLFPYNPEGLKNP
jgi:RHS repeat-associated protein